MISAVTKRKIIISSFFVALIASDLLIFQPASAQADLSKSFNFNVRVNFNVGEARKPVKFERIEGLIVFRAQVQGKDVWAVLDNLSDGSLLDTSFAQSVGLPMSAPVGRVRTQNGALERRWIDSVAIVVPGQISMITRLSSTDLGFFRRATGRQIVLIVGKELFDSLAFVVHRNGSFEIAPSGSVNVSAGVESLQLGQGRPLLLAKINGTDVVLAIDLRFNGDVSLSEAAWKRVVPSGSSSKTIVSGQADGQLVRRSASTLPNFSLGSTTLSAVEVTQGISIEGADGLLGTGVLSQFTFALDVKAGKLWLIPSQAPKPAGSQR